MVKGHTHVYVSDGLRRRLSSLYFTTKYWLNCHHYVIDTMDYFDIDIVYCLSIAFKLFKPGKHCSFAPVTTVVKCFINENKADKKQIQRGQKK